MFNQMEFCCLSWNPFDGPFIIDYLMQTNTFIVLLTRDIEQVFVSQMLLLQSGLAHFYSGSDKLGSFEIGEDNKLVLQKSLFASFETLYSSKIRAFCSKLCDYPHYIIIDYSDFDQTGRLPEKLLLAIQTTAIALHEPIDVSKLQLGKTNLIPSDRRNTELIWF